MDDGAVGDTYMWTNGTYDRTARQTRKTHKRRLMIRLCKAVYSSTQVCTVGCTMTKRTNMLILNIRKAGQNRYRRAGRAGLNMYKRTWTVYTNRFQRNYRFLEHNFCSIVNNDEAEKTNKPAG